MGNPNKETELYNRYSNPTTGDKLVRAATIILLLIGIAVGIAVWIYGFYTLIWL